MTLRNPVESNIWKLNLLQVCRWFMLIMPVIVLFYYDNGLSMQQVMLLQAIYSLVLVACEIPSGYISDTLGRKNCLVAGSLLGTLGLSLYCVSSSFYGFLAAEIALAVGQSCVSGTDSALLYDTLHALRRDERYMRHQGRMSACGNFSEAAAGILGGFTALISLRANFYGAAVVMAVTIPLCLSIREPAVRAHYTRPLCLKAFSTIVADTFRSPRLRWLVLHCGVILAATLNIVWFVQPYLQQAGVPLMLFGCVWTALNLSVGLASVGAHRVHTRIGDGFFLAGPVALIGCSFVILGLAPFQWTLAFLLGPYIVRGLTIPYFFNAINKVTTADRRATVLSIRVFVTRLMFAVTGPFFGWVHDRYSLQGALITAGIIFCALGCCTLRGILRHR
jgi:MFS family permease